MKEYIIIPAYNEGTRISKVIKDCKKFSKNIIVIDDGSKDNTYNIAKNEGVTVLKHIINLGKGAALKTGCDFALLQGAQELILIDADGQHNPNEIPKFKKALEKAHMVFGARKINNKKMPALRRIGNYGLNKITNIAFGIKIHDAMCGYRGLTAEAYSKIKWKSTGYEVEAEMIANAGKHKLKTTEIEVETIYQDAYKGMTIFDGLRVGMHMIWWKIVK